MPAPRRAMRKILEVLRLKFEARLSHESIAAATRLSKGAVNNYLRRAQAAGIAWPLPVQMDEAQLEALLFPHAAPLVERHAAPDFAHLHQELKRKGVTLMLLWEEYAAAHAGQAYRYSQFCLLYHRFAAGLTVSARCARCTVRATSCSSTTRGTRYRLSTLSRARCVPPRSSWRCWAPPPIPTPKPLPASSCPTGSHRTCAASSSWGAWQPSW